MKLTLGFSPCPNDTFIFDALVNGKIDSGDIDFEVVMADVEELNRMALNGELDITKLSFHAFMHANKSYSLLNAGAALGRNVGPLLISNRNVTVEDVDELSIAIPGKYTTANFLLDFAFPNATDRVEVVFSEVENLVIDNKVDLGVIIHENRFTYMDKGLSKIMDLGEFWEKETGMPIPLGGIVMKKSISKTIQQKVEKLLQDSLRFAWDDPSSSYNFISNNAQEMKKDVMYKHIDLYVNEFTFDLGVEGRQAVTTMFEKGVERGVIDDYNEIFI